MPIEFERQLTRLQTGDHVCPIYETQAERMAIAVPFVKEGLAQAEQGLYIADERSAEQFIEALAAAGVDVVGQRERNALRQLTDRDDFLRSGEFVPEAMIDFLREAESAALRDGFSGLRIAGEMSWATGLNISWDRLIEYEALLNEFLQSSYSIAICQYDRSRFDPAVIHDVLRTHPVAILGEQVCPNLFYEPPRMVLSATSASKQVEWKMSQLRRARSALQISEHRSMLLRAVVEGTTDAVFVKDRSGRYLMINSAGARFLGKSVEEVIGKDDTELFTPETARSIMETDRRVMATGETETCEEVGTAAGVTNTFLATKGPYRDQLGKVAGVIGIAREITESKLLQAERDRLLERLRLQIERLPVAYILMDSNHRVLDWNPAAERVFGFTKEEALGRSCLEFIHAAPIDDRLQDLVRRIQAGDLEAHNVNDNRRKDGRIITCEWFNTPLIDSDGQFYGVLSVAQDVTESKRAQEALREHADNLRVLSRRVVEDQEEDRRHLARELHDEIGQVLSVVSVNLQALKEVSDAAARDRLEESTRIVDDAIRQVRNLALDLRPAMLDDLGLVPTLRWYADRQSQRAGFLLQFDADSTGRRLPAELETACYRVVQEAFTNVVRHAQARQVWLELREEDEQLRLVIRDDGIGFHSATQRRRPLREAGFGMQGMRERVELLGGKIEITSEPGQGTVIQVCFPLESNLSHRAEE